VESALGAGEALQRLLKVAGEDPGEFKVWVWVKQQDIDPNKRGDLIVGDDCIHIS
jgi:hypothetical protein